MKKKKVLYLLITLILMISSYSHPSLANNENQISIYPNPLVDKATVHINDNFQGKPEIVIFNVIGKEIHRQALRGIGGNNAFEVDFSFLTPGVYFISLSKNSKIIATQKIVKKA